MQLRREEGYWMLETFGKAKVEIRDTKARLEDLKRTSSAATRQFDRPTVNSPISTPVPLAFREEYTSPPLVILTTVINLSWFLLLNLILRITYLLCTPLPIPLYSMRMMSINCFLWQPFVAKSTQTGRRLTKRRGNWVRSWMRLESIEWQIHGALDRFS